MEEAPCSAAVPLLLGAVGCVSRGTRAQRAATSEQLPQLQAFPHQQTSLHIWGKKERERCGVALLNTPGAQALPGNGRDQNCDLSGLRVKLT